MKKLVYDEAKDQVEDLTNGATITYAHISPVPGRQIIHYYVYSQGAFSFKFARITEHGDRQADAQAKAEFGGKVLARDSKKFLALSDEKLKVIRKQKLMHFQIIDVDKEVMPLDLDTIRSIMDMLIYKKRVTFGDSKKIVTAGMLNTDPNVTKLRYFPPFVKLDEDGVFSVNLSGEW